MLTDDTRWLLITTRKQEPWFNLYYNKSQAAYVQTCHIRHYTSNDSVRTINRLSWPTVSRCLEPLMKLKGRVFHRPWHDFSTFFLQSMRVMWWSRSFVYQTNDSNLSRKWIFNIWVSLKVELSNECTQLGVMESESESPQSFSAPKSSSQETGAPNVNFRKISVRKTIWDLEFSKHL